MGSFANKYGGNVVKKSKIVLIILSAILILLGSITLISSIWYVLTFGNVGFSAIVFTLLTSKSSAEAGIVWSYLWKAFLPSLVLAVLLFWLLWYRPKKKKSTEKTKNKTFAFYPFSTRVASVLSIVLSISMLITASFLVAFPQYIESNISKTEIYETEYFDPENVRIVFPQKKRNIIYIYLESMETTFLSKEQGGALEHNVIPELYDIAKNNVNFSHNTDVGGWPVVPNTTWTVASIVAQTSGVPLNSNFNANYYGAFDAFLPGIKTTQDILKENGYYQAVMLGSDSNFGYIDKYFYQHGVDKIYDLYTAREDGIVPKDYYVWWGMEDLYVYEYAKRELAKIANKDQPFMFTMMTIDTHRVGGYKCKYCGSDYKERYENVYSCASKQLSSFLDWLKEQPFYSNTTIVVCGDHATMDKEYIDRRVDSRYDRHVYNCIINSVVYTDKTKNRTFTPFDMFPTTLAAAGCKIEGERLGLGTNMFSDVPTLTERYSIKYINKEIVKSSDYYTNKFCKTK